MCEIPVTEKLLIEIYLVMCQSASIDDVKRNDEIEKWVASVLPILASVNRVTLPQASGLDEGVVEFTLQHDYNSYIGTV